jgi:phosphomevalonate kinase
MIPYAVSAPGKVLLAGGYLVLDKDFSGLVFALSARIHAVSEVDEDNKNLVTVRSPQFAEAEWKYNVLLNAQAGDNGDGGSDGDAAGLRGGVIVTAVEG